MILFAGIIMFGLVVLSIRLSPFKILSPSALLAGAWAFVFILQFIFASDMMLSLVGIAAIFIITTAFLIGEIVGSYGFVSKPGNFPSDFNFNLSVSSKRKFERIVIVFGVLSISGSIQYANALGLFDVGSFAELLMKPGIVREEIFSGEIYVSLLSRLGFVFSYSGVILAYGYLYIYKWRWFLMLPMLSVLLLGVSQSGRAGVLIILLQLMLVFFLKKILIEKIKIRNFVLKGVFIPLASIFCFFILGQMLREGFESSDYEDITRVTYSLRGYLFGGGSAFSTWLDGYYEFGKLTFGVYSFSSFFDLLGLFPQAPGVYDQYVLIAPNGETSNLFTAYRSFIDDFSIYGACLFYFFSGIFIARFLKKLVSGERLYIFILLPLISWLAYSPLASLTYYNSFILSCVVPFVIAKFTFHKYKLTGL